MSYAQRKELSGNRTLAIIIVALLQIALGYAIVTGLAYNVIKKAAQDLKTFDVEENSRRRRRRTCPRCRRRRCFRRRWSPFRFRRLPSRRCRRRFRR